MKFRIYSPENCGYKGGRKSNPTIRFSRKSGTVSLSIKTCEILGIKNGDSVLFLQDETREQDWYIQKAIDGNGFIIRNKSVVPEKPIHSPIFNSAFLVQKLKDSLKIETDNFIFPIATVPADESENPIYAIITKKTLK